MRNKPQKIPFNFLKILNLWKKLKFWNKIDKIDKDYGRNQNSKLLREALSLSQPRPSL